MKTLALVLGLSFVASVAVAQTCGDPEPQLNFFNGVGQVACPCFVPGEEVGVTLDAPADKYPIEILAVGIAWGSQFGGSPQQLEQAIHVYEGGLPDPGPRKHTLPGPQLTDGFVNEYNVSQLGWDVQGGPFSVTLELFNQSSGNVFAPSVVHDGNGCQSLPTGERNLVKAIPGGWSNACQLGVNGDWVMYVKYRSCAGTAVEDFVASNTSILIGASPNPFDTNTRIDFQLVRDETVELSVFDVRGRLVADVQKGWYPAGRHGLLWDGRGLDGNRVPAGTYFLSLDAGGTLTTRKVSILR